MQNVFWLIVTFEVICKRNFRHVQLPNCNVRFQHHLFGGHFENSLYSPQQSKQIVNFMAHIGAAADRCNLIDSSDQLKQFNDTEDNGSSWVIIQF